MFRVLLFIPFLFLRLFKLNSSFFFFNDWGRDMLLLQKWHLSGIPPLLGPLTSALPFNQSAFYFYLLYPGFLVSQGHPLANVFTCILFYLVIFIFLSFYLKKTKKLSRLLIPIFFLISIHPQFIVQNRFVWNPSFVGPLIILAYFAYQKRHLLLFSASIALAISLSYSVAPLLIAFFLHWLFFDRQNFKKYFLFLFLSFLFFNLPTLAFEIRHHFFLTHQLFSQSPAGQGSTNLIERFTSISQYLFATSSFNLNIFLFVISIIISLVFIKKTPFFLFFITAAISILLPIRFHYQYIFPLLCLLFICLSSLSLKFSLPLIIFLSIFYLHPQQIKSYFLPPQRSYQEMADCYKRFCQNFKETAFVSTQANFHTFHNGPEHRYLLRQSGCSIKDIETENGQANYMIVAQDGSQLSPDITYYELQLFGKYKTLSTTTCTSNFSIKVIQKINDPHKGN